MTIRGNEAVPAPLIAFPPIADKDATILILGSMPGVASLQAEQYYAHPRNAFWPILSEVFKLEAASWEQKVALLHSARLAIWDVLKECQRPGSLDSNIRKESIVCNDFAGFLHGNTRIARIVFNGKTAQRLFLKHVVPTLHKPETYELLVMPSTSPAMASLRLEQKTTLWREALLL